MNTIKLNNINYLNNPYPHCVIDNFFDTDIANKLHEIINSLKLKDVNSKNYKLNQYNKFAFREIEKLPSFLKNTFVYLNSKWFITKLEKLTGISDLVYGDPILEGAGVHIIKNEGFLKRWPLAVGRRRRPVPNPLFGFPPQMLQHQRPG